MLERTFFEKLYDISNDVGLNPRDLLLIMYTESGVQPGAKNPGGARGLIQFEPSTLKGLGASRNDIINFAKKSAEEQLNYVKKYVERNQSTYNGGQPFGSATKLYHSNFYPATLYRWNGSDPIANKNVIVVSGRASSAQEKGAYNANKILDVNRDGIITVGDLTAKLLQRSSEPGFQELLEQLNKVAGAGDVTENSFNKKTKPKIEDTLVPSFLSSLEKLIDNFMHTALENPKNKFAIIINSDCDLSSKLEYARVLQFALKEELDASSTIFTNAENAEIECEIYAPKNKALEALNELCFAISDTFEYATKHIDGIKIFAMIIPDKSSNYQKLDIKLAEINYRKFQLKFLKGKNEPATR